MQELPQDCVSCQGIAYGFQFPGEKGSTDPVQPLFCCFFTGNSRNSQMDGYSMMFLCFPREHGTVRKPVFSPYDRALKLGKLSNLYIRCSRCCQSSFRHREHLHHHQHPFHYLLRLLLLVCSSSSSTLVFCMARAQALRGSFLMPTRSLQSS